jgi:polyhydroxyalkanoate synthesis regulator phasin
MAEQWLSIVEYARATGISDMTIRRRIRTGRISAELREGKYFIPVDLDEASGSLVPLKNGNRSQQNSIIKNHPAPERSVNKVLPTIRRTETTASASQLFSEASENFVVPKVPSQQPSSHQVSATVLGPSASHHRESNAVPDRLARPLVEAGMASVEARGLIEFCHRALEQAKSTVATVEAKYVARLETVNSQLANKDQEIRSLNQQIEDLQLLVQILERKKIS